MDVFSVITSQIAYCPGEFPQRLQEQVHYGHKEQVHLQYHMMTSCVMRNMFIDVSNLWIHSVIVLTLSIHPLLQLGGGGGGGGDVSVN